MKIKGVYRENLRQEFKNPIADNISAFFLDKSIGLSNYVVLIMPKYFLHNSDFSMSREKLKIQIFNVLLILEKQASRVF